MYVLERTQELPVSVAQAWEFFSSPHNLAKITPKNLGFEVLGAVPERMYEGLFINYYVSPLFGIRMKWTTEITHVKDQQYFVDEQRIGPYRIWHHEHFFEATENGVRMLDRVHYALPFGILGRLVHPWLVKPRLEEIFNFRFKAAEAHFPA